MTLILLWVLFALLINGVLACNFLSEELDGLRQAYLEAE